MSAWVVSPDHIRLLLQAAIDGGSTFYYGWTEGACAPGSWHLAPDDTAALDEAARMLWDENVRSVSHRYPNDAPSELPAADCDSVEAAAGEFGWRPAYSRIVRKIEPVQVLKAVQCYEYQSCEHPEWHQSRAKAFCASLKDRMIMRLAGYDEAQWGFEAPPEPRRTTATRGGVKRS